MQRKITDVSKVLVSLVLITTRVFCRLLGLFRIETVKLPEFHRKVYLLIFISESVSPENHASTCLLNVLCLPFRRGTIRWRVYNESWVFSLQLLISLTIDRCRTAKGEWDCVLQTEVSFPFPRIVDATSNMCISFGFWECLLSITLNRSLLLICLPKYV